MELFLGKCAYDVQDVEMFALIQSYHEKAMAKFLDGAILNEKQLELLKCPLRVTLSNSLKSSGGNASQGMFITLNYRLLKQNMADLEWIYVHELAHIVCQRLYLGERGHGRTWKTVNSLMGFEPKRCHKMNTEGLTGRMKRYTFHCGCMVHNITSIKRNKILSGVRYTCKTCKGVLVEPSGEIAEMMKKVGIISGEAKKQCIG